MLLKQLSDNSTLKHFIEAKPITTSKNNVNSLRVLISESDVKWTSASSLFLSSLSHLVCMFTLSILICFAPIVILIMQYLSGLLSRQQQTYSTLIALATGQLAQINLARWVIKIDIEERNSRAPSSYAEATETLFCAISVMTASIWLPWQVSASLAPISIHLNPKWLNVFAHAVSLQNTGLKSTCHCTLHPTVWTGYSMHHKNVLCVFQFNHCHIMSSIYLSIYRSI